MQGWSYVSHSMNDRCPDEKTLRGEPGWLSWSQCPILDLGSGHNLMVQEFEPCVRLLTDGVEPAWDSVSPSLSVLTPLTLSVFLTNK